MKKYHAPEAQFISLAPIENIALTTEEISNPFDAAVALDEQEEETEAKK